MVEIPDELRAVFTQTAERQDDQYVLEIPADEVTQGAIAPGSVYRVALLPASPSAAAMPDEPPAEQTDSAALSPPVTEGERRTVTIEDLGQEGDGIAKVDRGFVVIVPGGTPGEEVPVEIERVTPSVAFASRLAKPADDNTTANDATDTTESEFLDEFL